MPVALRSAAPSVQRPSLLSFNSAEEAPFDLWHRYTQAAEFIDSLCRDIKGLVRVLDVGCNVVTLLSQLLDPARVQVVRCDVIDGPADDSEYIKLEPGTPLPFDNDSFDAVVSLETLEHVPAPERQSFVAELIRVARAGVVLCCPVESMAVDTAERLANEAYQCRNGVPHPFLKEHADFGLPTIEDVRSILDELQVDYSEHAGISTERWLAATLLSEGVSETSGSARLQAELTRAFQHRATDATNVPYRMFFVIRPEQRRELRNAATCTKLPGSNSSATLSMSRAINYVVETAGEVLTQMDYANGHLPAVLRSVIAEQEKGMNLQEQRFQILRSYSDALTQSWSWRLLAPLRWLRTMLRPRGFGLGHLLPWRELEPKASEPNTWVALGDDPQFLVSCCLPAGWLRIRFRAESSVKSRIEFFAERCGEFTTETMLGGFSVAEGQNDEEFYLKLDQPTRAMRIDPLNSRGVIRIEQLDVSPRPGPYAVVDALRRKLRLLRAYRNTGAVLKRGLQLFFTGQWKEVAKKWALGLNDPRCTRHGFYEPAKAYESWIEKHRLSDADRAGQRDWAASLSDPPRISIVMPTYNTPEHFLRQALDSVVRQTYPHWELCIADDGSSQPHVRAVLEEYTAKDKRIRLAPAGRHGGISAATNAALALATGEFVALVDHDDELAEHALYAMAKKSIDEPQADVIYSDEDKIQPDGKRVAPFFKPDWSPEFFLGCMYTCHLSLYRTELVRQAGGFRAEFDGAQDYDLALRVIEQARTIAHVPNVLYHWRLVPNSTACGVAAKPHAHAAALKALEAHLDRTGRPGTCEVGPSAGLSFVRFAIRGTPTVSIIIPTLGRADLAPGRSHSFLENCIESVQRTSTWKHTEIITLDRNTMDSTLVRLLNAGRVKRITYDRPFNWSAVNNLGAQHAAGDLLLFLNDDIEVISPNWLEALLEFAQQPEIGAAGARLLFPDGGVQHVGVTVLDGRPGHPFYGYPRSHPGYFCRSQLPHNCSAVTGACLMTRADVFREMNGFDEAFPLNYNDVDYCFRLRQAGYRIVYTPHAELFHYESVTKPGVYAEELRAFQARWGEHATDPYYNPNLNPETFDYRIA